MIDTNAIRKKIIDLAIQGKLTEQLPEDGTAEELYQQIQEEKQKLIKEGKIKKEKPLPGIDEEEIPFEIPSNWKWVRFSQLFSVINGDRGENYPAKSTLKHNGIPFISALNLNGKNVSEDENLLCVDEQQYNLLRSGKLQKDDIVICIRGSLGKHGRFNFEKGAIASSLVITRLFCPITMLGDYEMIWLDSSAFPTEINKYNSGVAQPNLAANNLKKFLFPLPPLAEQKRIVERIEQVYSVLDIIDELQAKYADNLTVLKSKLIDLAIQGKLTEQLPEDGTAEELYQQIQEEKQKLIKEGKIKKEKPLPGIDEEEIPFEIPSNWKWVRFSQLFSVINGDRGENYPAKSTLKHNGIPFISALNLNGKNVSEDENLLCVDEQQYNLLRSGKLQKDDIVICIRGSLGKHGRFNFEKGAIASSLVITRLFCPITMLGDYEMIWLDSSAFPTEINKYNSGVAQPNLAANNLKKFLFPLPPLAEQKRIVAKLDEVFNIIDSL